MELAVRPTAKAPSRSWLWWIAIAFVLGGLVGARLWIAASKEAAVQFEIARRSSDAVVSPAAFVAAREKVDFQLQGEDTCHWCALALTEDNTTVIPVVDWGTARVGDTMRVCSTHPFGEKRFHEALLANYATAKDNGVGTEAMDRLKKGEMKVDYTTFAGE